MINPAPKTDLDLAPIYRTEGNYWKAKYFESLRDLAAANRGIARLRRRLERLKAMNTRNMKAIQLRAVYGEWLIGRQVNTEAIGDYPGGIATVTGLRPDPGCPDIVFTVKHPTWRTEDHLEGEIGICAQEYCSLVETK